MAGPRRRTLAERRAAAIAEVEAAKRKVAKLEADAAERIGRLALKAGLVDLELSDEQLISEFDAIASKFRTGKAVTSDAGKAAAGEG